MEQPAWHRRIHARIAIFSNPGQRWNIPGGTLVMLGLVEVHKPADKKIQAPVVVVIEPHGARRPSRCGDSGLLRYIRERPIAVIVIENATAVLSYVQIREAIAVVVSHGCAHAISATDHAGFFRDVSERAVAIISV